MNYPDMNTMIERLYDKWGFVDLMPVGGEWRCADSTDEGIGGPGRFQFYGSSPLKAVQKAYRTIQRCYSRRLNADGAKDRASV